MKTLRQLLPILAALFLGTAVAAEVRPSSPVGLGGALRDAAKLAALHTDLQVMQVAGASMLPYFGDGSVLLVKASRSESLKPGAVVVYTNRFGETVAHRIIGGNATTGWMVKGYNNATADTTRVTDANLIGTVYVTLFATATDSAKPGDDILPKGTPIAMAAPAR